MAAKPKIITDLEKALGAEVRNFALNDEGDVVVLDLSNNQIADLSPLAYLTNLESLYLWRNQIADLSPLAHLTNLKSLYLQFNQIADLSPLAHLTNLESLYLWHNQIADLSPILPLIKSSRIRKVSYSNRFFTSEREINLDGNPLPPEVIMAIQSGGKEGLIEYFGALERGSVRIPEAKMVLLGEPRAGKTSLRRYLMGLPFDPAEASTPDIQISAWRPFEADEEADDFRKSIKINLWDFGGQEIQYSLHKLFMTEDTLYVIVLDSTKDQSPLPYLKFLEDYAPIRPSSLSTTRAMWPPAIPSK